jgi:HAD superfamily hydrolase (TIGR01509 family)
MTFREGVVFVANKFNLDHSKDREILELVDNCEKDTYMNDELLKLIPRLRKNGYKIGLISNYSAKLRQSLIVKKIDLLFDSIILSGEVGFQKPNREIFDCLFKNLNVKSSEVVFIDDTPKSLEKAEVIGYKPILFLNNEQLLADLIKLNVRV